MAGKGSRGKPVVALVATIAIAGAATLAGSTGPAGAAVTPEVKGFCKAVTTADNAVESAGERPTPRQQRRIEAALRELEETAPAELAAVVDSVAAILRDALENGTDPFENPDLLTGITAIDAFRFEECGYEQIETIGSDYKFTGFPRQIERGTVAIKFTNEGAELHELAMYRFKGDDTIKDLLGMSEKKARKRVVEVDITLAEQNQSSYAFVKFDRTGRYFAACFLPVGATSFPALESAAGPPHAVEGMVQGFQVTE